MVRKSYNHHQTMQNRSKEHLLLAKKRCILSRRPHLDIKEVKILTKSDVPEDNDMGIKTEFRVKVVEQKE